MIFNASPSWSNQSSAKETRSNVIATNHREQSAESYISGFLGGNYEDLFNSNLIDMTRFGGFVWFRAVMRPLSTWAWGQAIITDISVSGENVTVKAEVPDIKPLIDDGIPRSAAEWSAYEELTPEKIKGIRRHMESRTVKINALGQMDFDASTADRLEGDLLDEAKNSIEWVLRTGRGTRYIKEVYPTMKASTTYSLPGRLVELFGSVAGKD